MNGISHLRHRFHHQRGYPEHHGEFYVRFSKTRGNTHKVQEGVPESQVSVIGWKVLYRKVKGYLLYRRHFQSRRIPDHHQVTFADEIPWEVPLPEGYLGLLCPGGKLS